MAAAIISPARLTACFYCDTPTSTDLPDAHPRRLGMDHVFPKAALRGLNGLEFFTDAWRQRNKVPCCHRCNCAKANSNPLDWLATLTGDGAARLHARLIELGVTSREIDVRLAELARHCEAQRGLARLGATN